MDQRDIPNMSLEKTILDKMDLTDEQRSGAIKLIDAMDCLRGVDDIETLDGCVDHLPTNTNKHMTEAQMNSLMNVMDEFLNSYILVGYDMGGNRTNCFSFPSEMSADAGLTNALASVETCKDMVRDGILSTKNTNE